MRTVSIVTVIVLSVFALAASAQAPPAAPAVAQPSARPDGLYATFETSMGNIVVKLFEKESPITVKNFVDLTLGRKSWKDPKTGARVRRPLYAGTIFHRVLPGFMIQGGDPTGTGMGDPGFVIPDEFLPTLKFDIPGRLAMANTGEPKTGNCQFFVTEVPTTHLNGKHTIFGQVVEGQPLVGKIARVPRDGENKPRTAVRLVKVSLQRVGAVPPNAPEVVRPATATKAGTKSLKKATPVKKAVTSTGKPTATK
jgi:peptidyl-prolyl cis-trans isomerase A (cyclophilin A)